MPSMFVLVFISISFHPNQFILLKVGTCINMMGRNKKKRKNKYAALELECFSELLVYLKWYAPYAASCLLQKFAWHNCFCFGFFTRSIRNISVQRQIITMLPLLKTLILHSLIPWYGMGAAIKTEMQVPHAISKKLWMYMIEDVHSMEENSRRTAILKLTNYYYYY